MYPIRTIGRCGLLVTLMLAGAAGCKKQNVQKSNESEMLKKEPSVYWSDSPQSIAVVARASDESPKSSPEDSSNNNQAPPTGTVVKRVLPDRPPSACSVEKIQSVVRPHRDEVVRCYRKAVYKDPSLHGRLVIEMHIDKSGRARFLGVTEDALGDATMTRCIFRVLKKLAYPIPEKNACVVLYPFVFSAGPQK